MNKIVPSVVKMSLFGVLILLGSFTCRSQNPTQSNKSDFWSKVKIGGGIGLNFSNGGFNGSIAPSAIYQFNDYMAAGVGANVNFYQFNNQKFWAYGPSAIVLGNPIPQIQLSGEIEQLRVNSRIQTTAGDIEDNYWSPSLFIGAGYVTNFATVGIRYNVLHDSDTSIYLNAWVPFIRVYF